MRTTKELKAGVIVQLKEGTTMHAIIKSTLKVIRTEYEPYNKEKTIVILRSSKGTTVSVNIYDIECVYPKDEYPEYYL